MDDLDRAIIQAYDQLKRTCQRDPAQARRRLARRHSAELTRPLRAWCLAVRASDTRLDVPDIAQYIAPGARQRLRFSAPRRPHAYTLTASLLRTLCRPVRIAPPGEDWQDVAAKLGCHEESLRHAMKRRFFFVEHFPRLGGKRGKPVPSLYTDTLLDPASSNLRQPPDPVWGTLWHNLADRVPDRLAITLMRVPVFRPYPIGGKVQKRFRGMRWRCPTCRRLVRTVFYPLPVYNLLRFLGEDLDHTGRVVDLPINHRRLAAVNPRATFACVRCHNLRYFSRANCNSWNTLIAHLSAGLLFGHEVEKPTWWSDPKFHTRHFLGRPWTYGERDSWVQPTRPRRPLQHPRPAPRRDLARDLLLQGLTYQQIAARMRITVGTVYAHAKKLFRQYDVHSRDALIKKLRPQRDVTAARKRAA